MCLQNSGLSTRNLNPLGNTYIMMAQGCPSIPNMAQMGFLMLNIYAGFKLKLKKIQSFSKSLTVSSKHLCLVIGCCGVWWFLMILTCNLFSLWVCTPKLSQTSFLDVARLLSRKWSSISQRNPLSKTLTLWEAPQSLLGMRLLPLSSAQKQSLLHSMMK